METAESVRKECGKDMSPADLICYNRTATQQIHAGSVCRSRPQGMTKQENHKPEKKKESEQEVRDLPPKKDVKGGNSKEKERSSSRTGEVDFMRDYD